MSLLRDLPIKRKLLLVTLATCAAGLLLTGTALFWFLSGNLRSGFAADLASLGSVIAHNSSAPLAFDDPDSALEVISALKTKPEVSGAWLFNSEGKLLARYGAEQSGTAPITAAPDGTVAFKDGCANVALPVVAKDTKPGRLVIQAQFQAHYRRLLVVYASVLAGVLAASLLVAYFLASAMHRPISEPIMELAQVANDITRHHDYTRRAPVTGGGEVGTLTSAFNQMLEEIAASNSALRESQQRYEIAINGSSHGIWDWDLKANTVYFSPRWKEMLGWADSELPGRYEAWEQRIHPADQGRFREVLQAHLAAERPTLDLEYRLQHKDGTWRWIHCRGAALRDQAGKPIRLAGSHTDITARKDAEVHLERLNAQIAQAQREAGRAEAAATILHNVGNVLNSVGVSATLVRDELRTSQLQNLLKATAMLREHLHELGPFLAQDPKGRLLPGFFTQVAEHLAKQQARWQQELDDAAKDVEHIKQIVSYHQNSACQAGALESVPAQDLVEDALRVNRAALEEQLVTVVREYADVPAVAVDRNVVLQILINLVSNARHALNESRRSDKRLVVRVSPRQGEGVTISVEDNGVGISRENLSLIFVRGFTTRKDGHGRGLHSAAIAAREMGGSLAVHSDGPGTGATFTLQLPLAAHTS